MIFLIQQNYLQTEASSVGAMKATERVIKFLDSCDKPVTIPEASATTYPTECMDLSFSVAH